MASVNKTIYYYLILFATFIIVCSFIPLLFEIMQKKITSNIPYISLIFIMIGFLIYFFIALTREYYFHLFFYSTGLIVIIIILFLKTKFDKNNINIQKSITKIIEYNNS
jgi:hypothetical protein